MDERRERLDVRAHDDHVPRLQRGVDLEQMQDRVAQDLDLAGAAMAGMDPQRPVVVGQRRPLLSTPTADPPAHPPGDSASKESRASSSTSWCSIHRVALSREHHLHLPRVLPPGGEQPVLRKLGRRVVRRRNVRWLRRSATRSHSPGDGCSRNRWTSRCTARARSNLQPSRRQPGQVEQRDPLRQIHQARIRPQGVTGSRPAAPPAPASRSAREAAARSPPARPSPSAMSPSDPRAQCRTSSGRYSEYRSNRAARCRIAVNRRARRVSPPR